MMKPWLAACALLALVAPPVMAQGVATQRVCPIDGKTFTYMAQEAKPSSRLYLDMKRADSFYPWPHAKCPGNGFVIYKGDLSSGEIEKLRPFVLSEEYRALSEAHTTHYLEAVLRKRLGEPAYDVAWALVQATWEAASDPDRYRRYAEEALATYDSIPMETLTNIRFRNMKRMMSGELARRLGKFDSARDRFLEMRDNAELSSPGYQRIVEYQLKLIRAKDSRPRPIPD
jgi:hypothetical protein